MRGPLRTDGYSKIAVWLPFLFLALYLGYTSSESQIHVVEVVAKRFEFIPHTIEVCSGERVRLRMRALDTTHGIEIKAVKVKKKLYKGKVILIEFVAPKPGTYPFKCSHYCGSGHKRMRGRLVVNDCTAH